MQIQDIRQISEIVVHETEYKWLKNEAVLSVQGLFYIKYDTQDPEIMIIFYFIVSMQKFLSFHVQVKTDF